mgnify:CR=1 FL=1
MDRTDNAADDVSPVWAPSASPPPAWTVAVLVENAAVPPDTETLTLGQAAGATNGEDRNIGERDLPPLPPSDIFDARFTAPSPLNGLLLDLRDSSLDSATWSIFLQAGLGGYPIRLSWPPLEIPDGSTLRLQDAFGGLLGIDVDMGSESELIVANAAITSLLISLSTCELGWTLTEGWSMISMPCEPADATLATLFPDALSLFEYARGYELATSLATGTGYWINLPVSPIGTYPPTPTGGTPVSSSVLDLPQSWSMIGPFNSSVDVAALQTANSDVLSVFGFSGGYFAATTMAAGEGYWINLAAAGQVDLSGAAKPVAGPSPEHTFTGSILWAETAGLRQEIQLGVEVERVTALPPLPPVDMLDVRVEVDGVDTWQIPKSAGPTDYPMRVQGPAVTLGWKISEADVDQWVLVIDDQVLPLSGSGSVRGVVSSEEVSQPVGPWGPEGAPAAATKPRLRRLSGSTAHG